jgi:cell wall-associated NlpC family hydrolase
MKTSKVATKEFCRLCFLFIIYAFMFSSCGGFKIVTIQNKNKGKDTLKFKAIKLSEFQEKSKKVVDAARKQLGTPHLDKKPQKKTAVDCSEMTCKSYLAIGIVLPRTTSGQVEVGKFISKEALQKGDLVFFSSKRNNKEISHVGLVSHAENKKVFFIHTSTSRGVVEDDFYMEHWQNVFVTARRVL